MLAIIGEDGHPSASLTPIPNPTTPTHLMTYRDEPRPHVRIHQRPAHSPRLPRNSPTATAATALNPTARFCGVPRSRRAIRRRPHPNVRAGQRRTRRWAMTSTANSPRTTIPTSLASQLVTTAALIWQRCDTAHTLEGHQWPARPLPCHARCRAGALIARCDTPSLRVKMPDQSPVFQGDHPSNLIGRLLSE